MLKAVEPAWLSGLWLVNSSWHTVRVGSVHRSETCDPQSDHVYQQDEETPDVPSVSSQASRWPLTSICDWLQGREKMFGSHPELTAVWLNVCGHMPGVTLPKTVCVWQGDSLCVIPSCNSATAENSFFWWNYINIEIISFRFMPQTVKNMNIYISAVSQAASFCFC